MRISRKPIFCFPDYNIVPDDLSAAALHYRITRALLLLSSSEYIHIITYIRFACSVFCYNIEVANVPNGAAAGPESAVYCNVLGNLLILDTAASVVGTLPAHIYKLTRANCIIYYISIYHSLPIQ